MDKRMLSAIPRPVLTEKNMEMLLLVPQMRYLVTAQRMEVNKEDTLIMNFFHAEKKELKPAFRTFCQFADYITQDLTVEKTKWKTGAVNHLTGYLYWYKNNGNIVMASVEDRKVIMQFLDEFREKYQLKDYVRSKYYDGMVIDTEVEDRIDEYQDKIKGWKLEKRHKKEMLLIDTQMEKFSDVPNDYEQFVREKVFSDEHYIFYNMKKGTAYCTKCELDFELDKEKHLRHKKIPIWNDREEVKHNHSVACPYCGEFIKCKSEGMSRQKLFAVQWSVLVQKHEKDVLVRYFCHTKDFRKNYRNPIITTKEKFRTVHTEKKAMDFEWARFKSTYEYRWCIFQDGRYNGWQAPAEINFPKKAVLYNMDLLEVVSNTCMKYSAVDVYMNYLMNGTSLLNNPWSIDQYFNRYRKMPYLEQLLKVGFYKIAQSVMEDRNCPKLQNGKTVLEILGVNKLQFNMLREVGNPTIRDVMILRYARTITKQEFNILRYVYDVGYDNMYEKYLDMRQYTTIYKIKKYIDKTHISHQMDYFDYAKWIHEMGYDMKNEFNLYPKDFKRTHDEKAKEYIKFQDKQEKENMERFNKVLQELNKESVDIEPMNLKVGGLFIRLPEKLDELKSEGETLHHCVGTYRDKVMNGKTIIFFIRKEEEPEKPYYTLEWKGKVIQCRGFRNCNMTPEVKVFVKIFQEKMLEYENTLQEQRKAG